MRPLQIPGFGQITSCIRCGACCRSSSPDLFFSDSHLVERGNISLRDLFTMREGEPVKNTTSRKIEHLETDIIKLKSVDPDAPGCIFLDEESQECGIYQTRPSICRAFKCWDKRQVEPVKASPFLTRQDLLANHPLWEIICDHQKRCDFRRLNELAKAVTDENSETAGEEIAAILSFDKSIRETAIEKGKLDPEIMNFLFGREMELSLYLFKLKLEKKDGRRILTMLS